MQVKCDAGETNRPLALSWKVCTLECTIWKCFNGYKSVSKSIMSVWSISLRFEKYWWSGAADIIEEHLNWKMYYYGFHFHIRLLFFFKNFQSQHTLLLTQHHKCLFDFPAMMWKIMFTGVFIRLQFFFFLSLLTFSVASPLLIRSMNIRVCNFWRCSAKKI